MQLRSRAAWTAIVLSPLFLLGCPKRAELPKPPRDEGPTLPTEPKFTAKTSPESVAALDQAISQASAAPKEKAPEIFLSVRKAYPDTEAGQEALYRAGVAYYELADYLNARKSFNELLFENPLFPKANDAKLKLGMSALELGAYRDAYQTLISLAEKATPEDRKALLQAASRAAEGAHLFADALAISLKLADEATTPEERDAVMARVTDLVEGKVPFVDIVRLADGLPPTHPAWPILTFKLARIYYHLRDWTRLQETLQSFVDKAPTHPLAPQAQELLARSTQRAEVKPKTVGVLLPLSGKYKAVGEAVLRGIQLQLQGSDIELVVKDTEGDVNTAGRAVEDLVFVNHAAVIIGPLLGDEARRAALVAEELQVPILSLSRAEHLTEIGPYVFRNMLTNSEQAEALARYAVESLGYKKFAMLFPNIPYGTDLANAFWDQVEQKGGEVRGAESYAFDATTFTTEAKKLVGRYYLLDREDYLQKAKDLEQVEKDPFKRRKALDKIQSTLEPVIDFDAIFIPDQWQRVGLIAPALAVEDIITNACDPKDLEKIKKTTGKKELKTVTLLGADQWHSQKNRNGAWELIERGQKYVLCSVYVDGFFVDSVRPSTKHFVNLFRESFKDGADPTYFEAIGYDSAGMVRSTIDKKKPQDRNAMREALSQIKDYEGATGPTSFDDKREAKKPLFLLTIDQKGIHELNPKEKVRGT